MATRTSQNAECAPIGVFDSGLGGLTVVRELRAALPHRDIVYLGDSARVPYGIKSLETVRRFAMEDAAFLLRFRPSLIVVACNTASAAAIEQVRKISTVPVIDVISPGARSAVRQTDGGMIGVIGTEATIQSDAYRRAIQELDENREVISVACPLLVPIVEEGRSEDDPIVLHVLCDYLRDMQRRRPGTVILGCTHYPLLSGAISKLMGPDVPLVSSAHAAALEVADRLCETTNQRSDDAPTGRLCCYTTGSAERFAKLADRFGGGAITSVTHVGTDELDGESELNLP